MGLFEKIFGTHSDKEIKRILNKVNQIEDLEPKMEKLSDDELKVLLKSTPDLMDETQIEEFTNKNSGPTLERTDSSAGFSYIKMTLYLIVITNILGFIIAYLLTR